MDKRKKNSLAHKSGFVVMYLGKELPDDRGMDMEPNCNIQWDSRYQYKDDTMTVFEHSVGTHTYDNGKPGFHRYWNVKITYRGKDVFVADSVGRKPAVYISGRWEEKLATLYKKAKKIAQDEEKKRKKQKSALR